jgi:hypothetical protein
VTDKPLFVALRSKYFEAFAAGTKTIEYRRYGPRWNERTARIGRRVVLSNGYSGARLQARVMAFAVVQGSTLADCEPYSPDDLLAAIGLELLP